jgi:hypothetical protein
VIVENEQFDGLIHRIEKLYLSELRDNDDPSEKLFKDFHLSKDIVSAVDYHFKKDADRLLSFEQRLDSYTNELKELQLRDTQVRAPRIKLNIIGLILYFTLGFPFFLCGYLTNYPAYWLAGVVSEAIPLRDDFVGSIKLSVGMLVFLVAYVIESTLVGYLSSPAWATLFALSLYPAGVFALAYSKRYYRVSGSLRFLHLFMRKSNRIARLKTMRESLIKELEIGKEEYLQHKLFSGTT